MEILAVSGIILLVAIVSSTLRKYASEYSVVINIAAGVLIFVSLISHFMPAVNQIENLISYSKIPSEYGKILFKSLGICFASQFAYDACKDAGESSLASKIEYAGKISIVVTSLPLFEKITNIALNFMGVG